MTLLRVLHAEVLKLNRTIALKIVFIAPAFIFVTVFILAWQAPFSSMQLGLGDEWSHLVRRNLLLWAALMMPMFVTMITALLAGLEHTDNQWKSLLARPISRWTVYVTKLVVALVLVALSTLVLLCGILLSGFILPYIQPQLTFKTAVPWAMLLHNCFYIVALEFLALTIQHWVSLRWRSFSVAVATGMIALVLGFMAATAGRQAGWPKYFPWALPMLVIAQKSHDLALAALIGFPIGLIVVALGCFEFSRRDIS